MQNTNQKSTYYTSIKNHNEKYLKPEDVYALIKHFSFTIQQRLEEIEKANSIYTCLNNFSSEKSDLQNYLIHRYDSYKTTDPIQVKLLDRLCERVIQIFLFYKQKCYQPGNFINMQQKIQCKLRQLMQTSKSYQYFPNARPKTQKIHIHLKQTQNNNTTKNDQTLYLRSSNTSNLNDIIINEEVINLQRNKSSQISDKNKQIQVGNLFRYIFAILKKGYLLRLKLEKRKVQNNSHNNNNSTGNPFWNLNINTKVINERDKSTGNKIQIQGTQALIRAVSSSQNTAKGNNNKKYPRNMFQNNDMMIESTQNGQSQKQKQKLSYHIHDFNRRKTSTSQFTKKTKQQKQLNYIGYQNQNQNNYKTMKDKQKQKDMQKVLNAKEVQKCLSNLYLDVLCDVQKYPLLRQMKNQQIFLKQAIKKNQFSFNQIRKYTEGYNKKYNPILIHMPEAPTVEPIIFQGEAKENLLNQPISRQKFKIRAKVEDLRQSQKKYRIKSKTQEHQGKSMELLKQKKNVSVQQRELLIFLKKQNKINRLSCLEKSSQKKRAALQNNQNRMNINLNATTIQRIPSQKKRNDQLLKKNHKNKNPEENLNDKQVKINSLFKTYQSQIFINQQQIKILQNSVQNQRADLYCPIVELQKLVSQSQIQIQIALKQNKNPELHKIHPKLLKNDKNQAVQTISVLNSSKIANNHAYMNIKNKGNLKFKQCNQKNKEEIISSYENRLYDQQINQRQKQKQKQKLIEDLTQNYQNLDFQINLGERIFSKRKKQHQKQGKNSIKNSRKQNSFNGALKPSKIINMNFGCQR